MSDEDEPGFKVTKPRAHYAKIPIWVINSGAGCNAIAAYVALYSLSDWNTLRGYPNRDTLASHLGISRSSVNRALKALQDVGALVVTKRRDSTNSWTTSLYQLIQTDPNGEVEMSPDDTSSRGSESNEPWVTGDPQSRSSLQEKEKQTGTPSAPDVPASPRMSDRPASERFDTSLLSYKLCAHFHRRLIEHTPDSKAKIHKRWVDEADRMLRIDGRERAEVRQVIDWMFTNPTHPFWGNTCQSVTSLRSSYEKIRGAMWSAVGKSGQNGQERPRGVQQQPQGAPVQFGTDGKVTEAYRIWEREQRAAMKADMIDEVGTDIEQMRADGRLPPWWDDV